MPRFFFVVFALLFTSFSVTAMEQALTQFAQLYKHELGSTHRCVDGSKNTFKVCSDSLRNEGNAPYILHHGKQTPKVIVLFHGLSDSPFFLKSIATALYRQGHNVVIPLLPGHGKKQANDDMQDGHLAQRWQQHVAAVMALAAPLGQQRLIGGFSAGGTLAVQYTLTHKDNVAGLMLFSAALALSDNAEKMSNIWGIKWVAKIVDGDYQTAGPNPYKYPTVAGYAGLMLMDVIKDIRRQFAQGNRLNLPLFAAHSHADVTTLYTGIDSLLAQNEGDNTLFAIDAQLDVCHADLVISAQQLLAMNYDKSQVKLREKCKIPQANPVYAQMQAMLLNFAANI